MVKKPNLNQREAISMILDPSPTPPIIICGPFGTGKTFTLSLACMSILNQASYKKVLICTHTNSAADIHLGYLDEKIKSNSSLKIYPLRVLTIFLTNLARVPARFHKYCNINGNIFFLNQ